MVVVVRGSSRRIYPLSRGNPLVGDRRALRLTGRLHGHRRHESAHHRRVHHPEFREAFRAARALAPLVSGIGVSPHTGVKVLFILLGAAWLTTALAIAFE